MGTSNFDQETNKLYNKDIYTLKKDLISPNASLQVLTSTISKTKLFMNVLREQDLLSLVCKSGDSLHHILIIGTQGRPVQRGV